MNIRINPAYLIILAVLFFSSCGQEDVPYEREGERGMIIFHTSLPGVSTRASEIVMDLSHFYITAFNPADNGLIASDGSLTEYIKKEDIMKEAGTDAITSEKCIWPEPGKDGNMSFFAYYPELDDDMQPVNASRVSATDTIIDYKITDFLVATDIADQVDFVSAYTTGSMAKNLFSGITLAFEHQMSRIEVMAWGANKSYDIEIAGVRIGGVAVKGTFDFNPAEGASAWSELQKGYVEYLFRQGDEIVTFFRNNNSHATPDAATSIMGADNDYNCAMLIPSASTGWNYAEDPYNTGNGMYISVLLRVIDADATQQYPYKNTNQGVNALNIPVVYLAVDKATGKNVSCQLYKSGDAYYTDEGCTTLYSMPATEDIKEFGWAALPITANWEAGYVYTYTLDYSYGVGLHGPEVTGDSAPVAGDPIFSDIVGVTVSVKGWQGGDKTTHTVEVPGS